MLPYSFSDSRDEDSFDDRKKKSKEKRSISNKKQVAKLTSNESVRRREREINEDTSMSILAIKENKKSLKKERYSKGIEAACIVIVEISVRDGNVTNDKIDTALASLLCGIVLTSKSPKGKKALGKASQTDRDFVKIAMITCKKTKEIGGGRYEMECATASVLACRGLRKYSKCKFNETTIGIMSDNIAMETVGMMDDGSDECYSEDEATESCNSNTTISKTHAEKYYCGKKSHRNTKKSHKLVKKIGNSNRNNKNIDGKSKDDFNSTKKYVSNVARTIDYCVFEEEESVYSDRSVKSISSLDSKLRETSINTWNENIWDYMTYGFAEAMNIFGENLLSTSKMISEEIRS